MTDFEWQAECRYCADVADKRGRVREMNYSASVFCDYLAMQHARAEAEGFFDAATYLAEIADDMEDA